MSIWSYPFVLLDARSGGCLASAIMQNEGRRCSGSPISSSGEGDKLLGSLQLAGRFSGRGESHHEPQSNGCEIAANSQPIGTVRLDIRWWGMDDGGVHFSSIRRLWSSVISWSRVSRWGLEDFRSSLLGRGGVFACNHSNVRGDLAPVLIPRSGWLSISQIIKTFLYPPTIWIGRQWRLGCC